MAGHKVRPGWKRGRPIDAGGCRCSGRGRQAAGRCRCHRLDVAAWIQADSFGARGWRLQRFSAADDGREADAIRSLSKIRIPGAHVRRMRLFSSPGVLQEYRHDRKRMKPTANNIDAVIALYFSGSIKTRELFDVTSANCFGSIYERLIRIVAAMR